MTTFMFFNNLLDISVTRQTMTRRGLSMVLKMMDKMDDKKGWYLYHRTDLDRNTLLIKG